MDPLYHQVLLSVEKPGRYIGNEFGSIKKDKALVRWALCFPDLYEIAESHLGLKILYAMINSTTDWAAERVYAPGVDMEALLKKHSLPLVSLENKIPLQAFDCIGFTLSHELCYTTVLNMLALAELPLYHNQRKATFPLIIGGGGQSFNPEPIADFFDCFVVGEAEPIIEAFTNIVQQAKADNWSKQHTLEQLSELPSVYVPSLPKKLIKKAKLPKLIQNQQPQLLVQWVKPVHDRIACEIQRGCDHGCRFCNAGMITRPVRQKKADEIISAIQEGVSITGNQEVGLLSLSAADHPEINKIIQELITWGHESNVSISLPSLRLESLSTQVAQLVSQARRTGFTLAPEAGSERLRRVINKGNSEKELLAAVDTAISTGWQRLKFYFMIGLPTETDEDIQAIADLIRIIKRKYGRATPAINVSVAIFIPKPHTPFQWAKQSTGNILEHKIQILRDSFRGLKNVKLSYADQKQSFIEGIFARGNRTISPLLESAWLAGANLDSWSDHFNWDAWEHALTKHSNLSIDTYFEERDLQQELPWDFISTGVPKGFLLKEYKKALQAQITAPGISGRIRSQPQQTTDSAPVIPTQEEPDVKVGIPVAYRLRIRFAKEDTLIFLSHLETMTQLLQALRRARMPIAMSGGHHPMPRVGFGPALPLGFSSCAELMDVGFTHYVDAIQAKKVIQQQLPQGLRIVDIWPISSTDKPAFDAIHITKYQFQPLFDTTPLQATHLHTFNNDRHFFIKVLRKHKTKHYDLKQFLSQADIHENTLEIHIKHFSGGMPKPMEIAQALTNIAPLAVKAHKADIALSNSDKIVIPSALIDDHPVIDLTQRAEMD